MKHVDEYRDASLIELLAEKIRKLNIHTCKIMEICGGQTHSIMKYNLTSFLPKEVELVHGPGCPVCVTPAGKIDHAIALANESDKILVSFGDMLRVPGTTTDLLSAKARGANVQMVYSPLDGLEIAQNNPDKEVIFFAIGFETTAPVNALALLEAKRRDLKNFYLLCSQVLVPPAMNFILSSPDNQLNGFLAAGHVCTITGFEEYIDIAERFKTPIAVTGFEPVDILQGIYAVLKQINDGTYQVTNEYKRAVTPKGNLNAQKSMSEVFEIVDQEWRGIGVIPGSGLGINRKYQSYDAEHRFQLTDHPINSKTGCLAGEILLGKLKPDQCPEFGKTCTPDKPMGSPMVSAEGACSAYFRYKN